MLKWLREQFELGRSGVNGNMRPMEGLRGFAVTLVFLVHYISMAQPWVAEKTDAYRYLHYLHTIGNAGVDLFFVLSGYLIYGSLVQRQQAFLPFIRRRVQRIYPAFTVVFFIYLALSIAMPADSKIPREKWEAILYVCQNYLLIPGLFPVEPIITVAWSLSYELFFYMAIPLVISVLNLRERDSVWRIKFFVVATALITAYCAWFGGPARLIMFIAGMLVYEVVQMTRERPAGSGLASMALVMALLCTNLPITGPLGIAAKASLLFVAFFVVCMTCFTSPNATIAQFFGWNPLRQLGNMSYSYYLVHGLALKAIFMVLNKHVTGPHEQGVWLFAGMLPIVFAATLIPSAALFLVVERRFSLATPSGAG